MCVCQVPPRSDYHDNSVPGSKLYTYCSACETYRIINKGPTLLSKSLILFVRYLGILCKRDEHMLHSGGSQRSKDANVKEEECNVPQTLFVQSIRALVGNEHKLVTEWKSEEITRDDRTNDSKWSLCRCKIKASVRSRSVQNITRQLLPIWCSTK